MATKVNIFKPFILAVILLLWFSAGKAQNLENLGKGKPLKLTGGISANQVLYLSNDSIRRRDPYNWVLTGNINFNIYGWNVPFSYTFSNYQNSFQQPFNQYSINPAYKWIALHAGYCSMNFSPYSLSGHIFLGAGVDLTPPGIFRASIMYGRLLRAIEPDTANKNVVPSYRRMGYGIKVGLVKSNNSLEFIMFKAYDDNRSLKNVIADSTLKARENLVLSLGGKVSVMKGLTWNGEIAGSAINDNINDPGDASSSVGRLYTSTGLFKSRSSSLYYKAMKTALNYAFEKSTIGLAYERIDPGYATLGTYYSNNDYVNYTANMSTNLFNKISLSLSAGIQQDDLDHKKTSSTKRFISSVNVAYNVNEKLNVSTSYSGFQTYTRVKSQFEDINRISPYQYIDTLNFTQLTNSLNTNVSYNFARNAKKQQYLSFNVSYQKASDQQSSKYSGSDFINSNICYAHTLIPIGLTSSASINVSSINAPGANSLTLGPSISVSKNMLKKTLRPTLSLSVNRSYANGAFINSSFISRLMANYTYKKKHNLMVSLVFASIKNKNGVSTGLRNEFTGTMGYAYNF
jgi:hypothetical protein